MLLNAIICNFGRFVEVRAVRICEILIALMADAVEDIRNAAKRVGQSLIVKLSSYSVKKLLPHLLRGL